MINVLLFDSKLKGDTPDRLSAELNVRLCAASVAVEVTARSSFRDESTGEPMLFTPFELIVAHLGEDRIEDFFDALKRQAFGKKPVLLTSSPGVEGAPTENGVSVAIPVAARLTGFGSYIAMDWEGFFRDWLDRRATDSTTLPNTQLIRPRRDVLQEAVLRPLACLDILLQGYQVLRRGSESQTLNRATDDSPQKRIERDRLFRPTQENEAHGHYWFDTCGEGVPHSAAFTDDTDRQIAAVEQRGRKYFRDPDLSMLKTTARGPLRTVWRIMLTCYGDPCGFPISPPPSVEDTDRLFSEAVREYSLARIRVAAYLSPQVDAFEQQRSRISHDSWKNDFLLSLTYSTEGADEAQRNAKFREATNGNAARLSQLRGACQRWALIREQILDLATVAPRRCGLRVVDDRYRGIVENLKKNLAAIDALAESFLSKSGLSSEELKDLWIATDGVEMFFDTTKTRRNEFIVDIDLPSDQTDGGVIP